MPKRPPNQEVLVAAGPVVTVAGADIDRLRKQAGTNARQRMRLCAHQSLEDRLHEMLIVLARDSYVRPHKHPNKTESFHIVEGRADLVLFDEYGKITSVLRMGEYASGRTFYYRLCAPYYHTVFVRSDFLTFHETTNGPFQSADTIFAHWAPEEADVVCRTKYLDKLGNAVDQFAAAEGSRLSP